MSTAPAKICAVTGASGYLGSRLSAALERDGWRVVRLSRRPGPDGAGYSLTGGVAAGFFQEHQTTALVHCAWDFSLTGRREIVAHNVDGSVRLLEQAHSEGVKRIVFISTISAFEGCRSLYGQAKLAVEERARRLGVAIVRPGLVYGDDAGGIVGAMDKAVRRLPLVPLIGRGRQLLYPAHEDDVAALVVGLADGSVGDPAQGPIIAASEHGRTLREIVSGLATTHDRRARVLPIPWRPIWALLKGAEACGLRPGFRSDSVLSLVNQDPSPDFAPTRSAGVAFRDLAFHGRER